MISIEVIKRNQYELSKISGNLLHNIKSFPFILRLEMILSVISYERKNVIFYEKNFKLTKSNTFNNVFGNQFFFITASYKFF